MKKSKEILWLDEEILMLEKEDGKLIEFKEGKLGCVFSFWEVHLET